jgi:hypothetical protein
MPSPPAPSPATVFAVKRFEGTASVYTCDRHKLNF